MTDACLAQLSVSNLNAMMYLKPFQLARHSLAYAFLSEIRRTVCFFNACSLGVTSWIRQIAEVMIAVRQRQIVKRGRPFDILLL